MRVKDRTKRIEREEDVEKEMQDDDKPALQMQALPNMLVPADAGAPGDPAPKKIDGSDKSVILDMTLSGSYGTRFSFVIWCMVHGLHRNIYIYTSCKHRPKTDVGNQQLMRALGLLAFQKKLQNEVEVRSIIKALPSGSKKSADKKTRSLVKESFNVF